MGIHQVGVMLIMLMMVLMIPRHAKPEGRANTQNGRRP